MAIAVFALYLIIAGTGFILAVRLYHFAREHPAKALVLAVICFVCISAAADLTKGLSQKIRKTTASLIR